MSEPGGTPGNRPGTGPEPDLPLTIVPPRYGAASLAEVLPGALAALGVPERDPLGLAAGPLAGVRRIVVLLVDGLGFHLWPAAGRIGPVFAEALPDLRELTAPFPSTTPVSLTTLGTGAPPGTHGIIGFTVAIPGTDRLLTHLHWDVADGPEPGEWQPVRTAFQRAAEAGVRVTAVSRPEFEGSGLTVAAFRGARYGPAAGVPASVDGILDALRDGDRSLVYGYYREMDYAAHQYGLTSEAWADAVAEADRFVGRVLAGLPPDAALLVTADHGALDVPAEDRIDLAGRPELTAGVRLVAGEPRVRYLHTRAGAEADVLAAWQAALGPRALVMDRAQAVATGWFGPVTPDAAARIGDVVVACTGRHVVVDTVADPRLASLVAYHGSLTEAEMAVPLWIARP